ncbi:hypothetical protein JXD38_02690 [candidate division WOR-3 bacterium]|nr:hypothetical protein [candidate division WOR-3 bacterium]
MNVRTASVALLIAALVVIPQQAQAGAADKESYFVSGQLGLNYYLSSGISEDSPSSGWDLNLCPRVLYFPAKSIGVGGEADLYLYSNSFQSTSLAIGPRAAYYFQPDASRYPRGCCMTPWFGGSGSYWMPYAGVSVLYVMDRTSYTGGSTTNSGYRGRVGVGAAPMIGDHGTAFIELGFQTQSLKVSEASTSLTDNKIYLEGGFGAFLFKK